MRAVPSMTSTGGSPGAMRIRCVKVAFVRIVRGLFDSVLVVCCVGWSGWCWLG